MSIMAAPAAQKPRFKVGRVAAWDRILALSSGGMIQTILHDGL